MFDYAKKEASIVYRYDDIIYDSFLWLHGIALHFASDDIALKRDSLDDPYTSLQWHHEYHGTSLMTVCAAVHPVYQTSILILHTSFHHGMKQWKVIRVPRFLSLPYWVGKAPQRIDNIDIFFADMELRETPFDSVKMELRVMIRNYIHRFAPEIIQPSEPLASSWTLTTKNTPTSIQWRNMTT